MKPVCATSLHLPAMTSCNQWEVVKDYKCPSLRHSHHPCIKHELEMQNVIRLVRPALKLEQELSPPHICCLAFRERVQHVLFETHLTRVINYSEVLLPPRCSIDTLRYCFEIKALSYTYIN